MATVMQVVHRLLPAGTGNYDWIQASISQADLSREPFAVSWSNPPIWPPDLFAVCATLVNLSGCYAHTDVVARSSAEVALIQRLGLFWNDADVRGAEQLATFLGERWRSLLAAGHEDATCVATTRAPAWCMAALELMALADEASAGIGFEERSALSGRTLLKHWLPSKSASRRRQRNTSTLCELVPPEECCVQPKSRTPQLGCTLRSLSHHLALLPPVGEVTTRYLVSPFVRSEEPDDELGGARARRLNLLIVPFPYETADDIFTADKVERTEGWARFAVDQSWLANVDLSALLLDLIERASTSLKAEHGSGEIVHGVILPELALDVQQADQLAAVLGPKTPIELFITGVFEPASHGFEARNIVRSYLFEGDLKISSWNQAKHHRWRLDRPQLAQYGFCLDPELLWWEAIDVSNREVVIYAFRHGATLATLVCEDLARVDPVQPLLRAIGPNLLVALLMDGPQLEWRWPGRYATVLADDPGTSVLTVTSLAGVDRYLGRHTSGPKPPRSVGLWKDPRGRAKELTLEEGSEAILLQLGVGKVTEYTLDRRSDGGEAVEIYYRGHGQVRRSPGDG